MQHNNGVIATQRPTVLDVVYTNKIFNPGYTRDELATDLRTAMIPTDAPYDDWRDLVPRALTLLPPQERHEL